MDLLEHPRERGPKATRDKVNVLKFRVTAEDRAKIYARAGGKRNFSSYARRVLRDGFENEALQMLAALQADVSVLAREVLERAEPIDAILIIARLSVLYEQARVFSADAK